MAEFLGEGREPRAKRQAKPAQRAPERTAPQIRHRQPAPPRDTGIHKFVADFKNELSTIEAALHKLLQHDRPRFDTLRAQAKDFLTHQVKSVEHTERERLKVVTIPQVLEREVRTAKELIRHYPEAQRARLLKDFTADARQAVASGVPQLLANIIRATSKLSDPVVLRPARGNAVEALMKVAKSMRAGRLAFVPAETRKQAQQLLNLVYGRRTGRPATWRDKETAKIIEQHRLIPLSMPRTEEPRYKLASDVARTQLANLHAVDSPSQPRALSIPEVVAHKLESSIPRFQSEGAGVGPKIIDTGESAVQANNMTIVYRDDSQHVAHPESLPAGTAAARRDAAAAARTRFQRPPLSATAAAAPTSASHSVATGADAQLSQSRGGLGASTGGGTVGGSGGPLRIEGRMRIPELNNMLADIEGTLRRG